MSQKGFERYLFINTSSTETPVWTEVDLAREVTQTREKDEIDSTARATARLGYKDVEDGLKSFGVEFDSLVPNVGETNAAFTKLESAYETNGSVDVLLAHGPLNSSPAVFARRATCKVFGGSESEPLNDNVTVKFTLKAKGKPTLGTVTTGAFTAAT